MPVPILSANHIGGTQGNYEPQRVNNAIIGFDNLPGQAKDEIIQLSLASFPLPKSANGVIELGYVNEKRKFAGPATFEDIAIVFNDFVDVEVAKKIQAWRYQVYNPQTGAIGLARTYKKTGYITMYAPNGDEAFNREFELIGCWPSNLDHGDIDLAGEDVIKINLTLTIDKAIPRTRINPNGNDEFGDNNASSVSPRGTGVRPAGQ